MYCPKCGTKNDDQALKCVNCGEVLQQIVVPKAQKIGDDPTMRMILPVGRSGLAITAGYVGLFAILIIPAPLALVLGILAIIDIKRHSEKHGIGRAIFAVIMGGLGSIVLLTLFGMWLFNVVIK